MDIQIELADEDYQLVSRILIEAFLNANLKEALKEEEERLADAEAQAVIEEAMASEKMVPRHQKYLVLYEMPTTGEGQPVTHAVTILAKDKAEAEARLAAIKSSGTLG